MIRRKREIKREIKALKKQLDGVIKGAIEREGSDNETISLIEERLNSLRSETRFEDTIEGRICLLEITAFDEIDVILKGLSTATGRNYHMKPHLYPEDHINNQISLEAPFPATLRERPLRRKI